MTTYHQPPTLEKAMEYLFHQLWREDNRLFVPDEFHKIDGFDFRFNFWMDKSSLCAEAIRMNQQHGEFRCTDDEGHSGAHWGGMKLQADDMSVADSFMRSLNQEGTNGE